MRREQPSKRRAAQKYIANKTITSCRRRSDSPGQPRYKHVQVPRARRLQLASRHPSIALVLVGGAWYRTECEARGGASVPLAHDSPWCRAGGGVEAAADPTRERAAPHDLYFERQQPQFCQVHATNNAAGMQLLTGPVWMHAFDAVSGNFSIFALNHWLHQHRGVACHAVAGSAASVGS